MTAREEGRGGGGGGMRGRAWCPLHLAASLQLSESAKSEQKQRKINHPLGMLCSVVEHPPASG